VFRLIVVLFCVMCVVCELCLIVVPLPPGENPFAVKINNNKHSRLQFERCSVRILAGTPTMLSGFVVFLSLSRQIPGYTTALPSKSFPCNHSSVILPFDADCVV
jgi:hypothetical protein